MVPHSRAALLRGLAGADVDIQQLVAQTRHRPRRPSLTPPSEDVGWSGHRPLRFCHVLCRYRLGDVPVSALGLHDLRLLVCWRAAGFLDVADDLRRRAAFPHTGSRRRTETSLPARPWETSTRLRDVVGLLQLLAAIDHLGRQRPRRNQLLPFALVRRMGLCLRHYFYLSLFRSIFPFALA